MTVPAFIFRVLVFDDAIDQETLAEYGALGFQIAGFHAEVLPQGDFNRWTTQRWTFVMQRQNNE